MSKTKKPVQPPAPVTPQNPRPPRKSGIAAIICMALYQFAFDGKVSGRMQGNVMQRNGRSRAFVVPPLIQNVYTSAARGLFSTYSSLYRSLTAAQVTAWATTELDAGSNRLGVPTTMKGKQLYISLNVNLADVGGAAITDPPPFVGVVNPAGITTTAAAGANTVAIAWTSGAIDADTDIVVMAARSRPVSIFQPKKSSFRFIAVIPALTASPFSLSAAYISRFGNLTGLAGQRFDVKLYGVNNLTGQKVIAGAASTIVAV